MLYLQNTLIYSGNDPKDERAETGETERCAICEKVIFIDDTNDPTEEVDGLGTLCHNCALKEVEAGAA